MKKSELQLLLIVFGVLILLASWQFVYKSNQAKTQELNTQNAELQTTVDRLEILNAKMPEYVAGIE